MPFVALFEMNAMNFVTNLSYMAKGMLGIFIAMILVMALTYLINFLFKNRNNKQ